MSHASGAVMSMGELLIDFIATDGATSLQHAESFVARAGGAPANVTVALARLGIRSAFCGVAGSDPFGDRLQRELANEGVDTSRLRQTSDAATTLAYAWKDARGDGHFWLLRGADVLLSPEDAISAGISQLAALVVGSVSMAAIPTRHAIETGVELANDSGIPVVFDINLRPTVWQDAHEPRARSEWIGRRSTVVKLSLDDAKHLFGPQTTPEQSISNVLSWGARAVVLTDGDRGCWAGSSGSTKIEFAPAFKVDAIEPTGAGDAFCAALIAGMLASSWQAPTPNDLRSAAAAGALATTRHGAWDGLPTRDELDAFLDSHRGA